MHKPMNNVKTSTHESFAYGNHGRRVQNKQNLQFLIAVLQN